MEMQRNWTYRFYPLLWHMPSPDRPEGVCLQILAVPPYDIDSPADFVSLAPTSFWQRKSVLVVLASTHFYNLSLYGKPGAPRGFASLLTWIDCYGWIGGCFSGGQTRATLLLLLYSTHGSIGDTHQPTVGLASGDMNTKYVL